MSDTTFKGPGKRGNYSNTGSAIDAGDVIVVASGATGRIGIAIANIAATTGTGEYEREGRFTLPKAAGVAFTNEQIVYWTGSALTTASSGNTRAGRAAAAAASAATTADIYIND